MKKYNFRGGAVKGGLLFFIVCCLWKKFTEKNGSLTHGVMFRIHVGYLSKTQQTDDYVLTLHRCSN